MKLKYIISETWKSDRLLDTIEFCEFCYRFFEIPDNVMITIKLTNGFDEDGTTEKLRNNRYEIRISGKSAYDPILIVAHEFCHVWQMTSGRLKSISETKAIFDGKDYQTGGCPIAYLAMPYEVEARAFEEIVKATFEHETEHTVSYFEGTFYSCEKNFLNQGLVEESFNNWDEFVNKYFQKAT